jgi:hypothetical protein
MSKLAYFWLIATVAIGMFSTDARAQVSDQNAAITFQNRGTYSTFGNQTYGPHGTLQQRQGNQTYTIDRNDPDARGPTYSTLGHQTYGSDRSMQYNYGNRSYDQKGSVSQTQGNQTTFYRPGEKTVTCSTYGTQTVCR